ncbi:hypothetical protein [Yinghuangia seranimata]|uniref:hypothetical protein n=1 Tax=Yinghuangia seranimata TaxID=408067 RepID=UPI00248C755E|nr:hypothetical protein [Yinghuangia seranimata]MDI2129170.1 hypothetical protein [Yinghuangia seranimata]
MNDSRGPADAAADIDNAGDDAIDIAGVARRLTDADAGGWTDTGARALVADLGWTWRDTPDGPVADTGHWGGAPGSTARLRPVDRLTERHTSGETYLELAVPLAASPAGEPALDAALFRAVRGLLTDVLGEPTVIGSHGSLGPMYGPTAPWGAPYLRWRGEPDSLELRAGRGGPELVLMPTGPIENWFWRLGVGEEYSIDGYFGANRDPRNGGLGFPGGWYAQSWDTVVRSVGGFLDTVAAETLALGHGISMPVYGRGAGSGAPLLFDIDARGSLGLATFANEYAPELDLRALGWGQPADHPRLLDEVWPDAYDPRWRVDAGGPGAADGRALAEMLVATARAAGVAEPRDLIVGGEAESVGPYDVRFYGLGLPTG